MTAPDNRSETSQGTVVPDGKFSMMEFALLHFKGKRGEVSIHLDPRSIHLDYLPLTLLLFKKCNCISLTSIKHNVLMIFLTLF